VQDQDPVFHLKRIRLVWRSQHFPGGAVILVQGKLTGDRPELSLGLSLKVAGNLVPRPFLRRTDTYSETHLSGTIPPFSGTDSHGTVASKLPHLPSLFVVIHDDDVFGRSRRSIHGQIDFTLGFLASFQNLAPIAGLDIDRHLRNLGRTACSRICPAEGGIPGVILARNSSNATLDG
jgi:hypothetical protein